MKIEIILKLGAELGSVKLLGRRTPDGWLFRTSSEDQSAELLDEEDRDGLPLENRKSSNGLDLGEQHWRSSTNIRGTDCTRWLFILNSNSKFGRR